MHLLVLVHGRRARNEKNKNKTHTHTHTHTHTQTRTKNNNTHTRFIFLKASWSHVKNVNRKVPGVPQSEAAAKIS